MNDFELLENLENEYCPDCGGNCCKLINKTTQEIKCICGHNYLKELAK